MHIRTRGGRPSGKRRLVAPVAVSVLALAGAGLTAGGTAQAAESPAPPTQSEMRKQMQDAYRSALSSNRKSTPSRTPMIIGGGTTTISTAPWMAQLFWTDPTNPENGFFCGGSVVTPTKVVTAAHCVDLIDWSNGGTIVTGATEMAEIDATGKVVNAFGGTVHKVKRQWRHPSYDDVSFDNDTAVLTLATKTAAANLPLARSTDTSLYGTGTATVYGWGRTSSTSYAGSPVLKKADLPLVADTTCDDAWGDWLVKGHMVCAGKPATGSDAGTTTSCNGDSGGPLVRNGRLIGIVSWGVTDCVEKGYYSVFAKATGYAGPLRAEIYDANWTGDAAADLIARNSSDADLYPFASKLTSLSKGATLGDAAGINLFRQTDLNRDGVQDQVRRTTSGQIQWYNGATKTVSKIYSDWSTRKQIVAPGDVTGDDLPDLVQVTSTGDLYLNPGNGAGAFNAPVKAGFGWNVYSMVRGAGDLTGDGKTDLIARDSAGALYLYPGTGTAGTGAFGSRVRIGTGWNIYNQITMTGDVNNDGKADLLARDSAGTMWLYKGTGKSGATFATRAGFGGGWNAYNLFG
ncbi:trypsin-like serine protease [Streptomyces bambusae]|uniref:trypsin-like serine protease n=1 Tax=Streptomyces bambusae TaxID=1550616 RepID=UPI001CFD1B73|nr:trypsin-like serine protease [Streptomyces bambusae]MCB5165149.1 trypsin-like serine protease [Streptomyces bambusae]